MKARIEELRKEVENFIITNADSLEQFRINYLSKKGLIPSLFEGFRDVSPEAEEGDRGPAQQPEAAGHR